MPNFFVARGRSVCGPPTTRLMCRYRSVRIYRPSGDKVPCRPVVVLFWWIICGCAQGLASFVLCSTRRGRMFSPCQKSF